MATEFTSACFYKWPWTLHSHELITRNQNSCQYECGLILLDWQLWSKCCWWFCIDIKASWQEEVPVRGRESDRPTCDTATWRCCKERWENVVIGRKRSHCTKNIRSLAVILHVGNWALLCIPIGNSSLLYILVFSFHSIGLCWWNHRNIC